MGAFICMCLFIGAMIAIIRWHDRNYHSGAVKPSDLPPPPQKPVRTDKGWRSVQASAWIAVDEDGFVSVFSNYPNRNNVRHMWDGDFMFNAEYFFPGLLHFTEWPDSPVKVYINIEFHDADIEAAKEVGNKYREALERLSHFPE